MRVIDLHQDISDSLFELRGKSFLKRYKVADLLDKSKPIKLANQSDLPRLKEGGCQIFIGASCALEIKGRKIVVPKKPLLDLLKHINLYRRLLGSLGDNLRLVLNQKDLDNSFKTKSMGMILSIEGVYCLDSYKDLFLIDAFFDLGVRSIAPVWSMSNNLGTGCSELNSRLGLTELGKKFIKLLNQKGVIIDAVHTSRQTFWDIISFSSKPIIVSHAGCHSVHQHQRNLTDKQILALKDKKGLMGLCFVGKFIGDKNVKGVIKHLKHLKNLGAIKNTAIGSDFDGMFLKDLIAGLEDTSKYQNLVLALKKSGFTKTETECIMWKNAYNFLAQNLPKK